MKQILVVAPHPDDDIIACGGSIAKHCQNGNQVAIMYITSGDAGGIRYGKDELAAIREAEARQAAALLGINNLFFLRMADGYIEINKENLIRITTLIRAIKPHMVYIPHDRDGCRDHKETHHLLREACKRAAEPFFPECGKEPWPVETILGYEVWTPIEEVSYAEDISDFIDRKLAAIQQHHSQLEYYRYDEAVKGLNRYRGIMTGKGDYCEAFQLIKYSA
ncbi:PIG-L deacetylase family protein [Syntrophomonas curvata]